MTITPGNFVPDPGLALKWLLRDLAKDPSSGWISDTDAMEVVKQIYDDMLQMLGQLNGDVTQLEQLLNAGIANAKAAWLNATANMLKKVTVTELPTGSFPAGHYDLPTGHLELFLPVARDGVDGLEGPPGKDAPIFEFKRIYTATSPLELHDDLRFPRQPTGSSEGPWLYLLRFPDPAPVPPPVDGSYDVGMYFDGRITIWVFDPVAGQNPMLPLQDSILFSGNTNPVFISRQSDLLQWGLNPTTQVWPLPEPHPVVERVGPWRYTGDLGDLLAANLNASLVQIVNAAQANKIVPIPGPPGPTGPRGPAGSMGIQGVPGPKGDPGETFKVSGIVATAADLPLATDPIPPALLQVMATAAEYDANGNLINPTTMWVYDPNSGAAVPPGNPAEGWVNVGNIQGPKGDKGDPGSIEMWDQTGNTYYRVGQVVAHNVPGSGYHLFIAVQNGPGEPGVDPFWAKFAEPPENTVWSSSISGQTPLTHPPSNPIVGDIFVNTADDKSWVLRKTQANLLQWEQLSVSGHVYLVTGTGKTPTTHPPTSPVPTVGDTFINLTDDLAWVYTEPVTGTFRWETLVGPSLDAVMTTLVPGATPDQIWPTTTPPETGNVFINLTDNASWVWDGTGWRPLAPRKIISNTADETPTNNLGGIVLPATPQRGDQVFNTVDHRIWVWVGASWEIVVERRIRVTVLNTSGDVPTTTAGFLAGDLTINETDGLTWVFDGTNWLSLASSSQQITVSAITGETPTAPGTTVIPTPRTADIFLNTADSLVWLYDGTTWRSLTSPRSTITELTGTGEDPTTNPPTSPLRDDVIVNSKDQKTWIYDGTKWLLISEPPDKARGTVTYVTDTSPKAPFTLANNWGFGPTATVEPDPTTTEPEPGDVWINYDAAEVGVFS